MMQSCFTARMLMDEKDGRKQACLIVKGDWLWARDENDPTGPVRLQRVLQVFIRVAPILNLHVANQIIETTAEHPFYVRDRGWIPAKMLEIGDLLQLRSGEWVPVAGVAESGRVETVYNFEIEDYHTYFVSATETGCSIWAHNAANSYILGKNLTKAGSAAGPRTAAHHLVASTDKRAAAARAILKGAGIGGNSAPNGVWLPRGSKAKAATGSKAQAHSRVHTNTYYKEVNTRMINAQSRARTAADKKAKQQGLSKTDTTKLFKSLLTTEVRKTLDSIRGLLLVSKFPI